VQDLASTLEPRRVTDQLVLAEKAPGTRGLGLQLAGTYAVELQLTLCLDDVRLTLAP
jgi:hypothetical protein